MNRKTHPFEASDSALLEIGFLLLATGLLLSGGMIAYQSLQWLRFATWAPVHVASVWEAISVPIPHASWLGVQRIIDWFFDLSLAQLGMLVALLGFFSIVIDTMLPSRKRELLPPHPYSEDVLPTQQIAAREPVTTLDDSHEMPSLLSNRGLFLAMAVMASVPLGVFLFNCYDAIIGH